MQKGRPVYDGVATWVILVAVAALILLMSELGFLLGRKAETAADQQTGVVQAAAFTLVGLLLAFSFSMALGRFDSRRAITLQEANSIGTTALRSGLLEAKTAVAMRDDLHQYASARIAFASADADPQSRARADARSIKLQGAMWRLATREARLDPRSTTVPLLIQSLNETIDLSSDQAAVLTSHIPDLVLVVLVLIALIAAVLMGIGFGRNHHRGTASRAMFAVMLALAIGLIIDLDRPQRGLIRVSLEPLRAVQRSLTVDSPPVSSP